MTNKFGKNTAEVTLCSYCILTGESEFLSILLPLKLTLINHRVNALLIFPFVISNCFGGDISRLCEYFISCQTFGLLIYIIIDSCFPNLLSGL